MHATDTLFPQAHGTLDIPKWYHPARMKGIANCSHPSRAYMSKYMELCTYAKCVSIKSGESEGTVDTTRITVTKMV